MRLAGLFNEGGRGVIATSNLQGEVNVALYAMPHVIDDETLAWGMTEGRTYKNIMDNPRAAYLYMNPGVGFSGTRIGLKLTRIENSGEMLHGVRDRTSPIVGAAA